MEGGWYTRVYVSAEVSDLELESQSHSDPLKKKHPLFFRTDKDFFNHLSEAELRK